MRTLLPRLFRVRSRSFAGLLTLALLLGSTGFAAGRADLDLSGSGWKLWFDASAHWRDDTLYFPAPELAKPPVNAPTAGWPALTGQDALAVEVPGTTEEYLQKKPGPEGDLVGVSWWTRTITLPAADGPRRVLLRFESVRQRAEIFINRHLAGYDVVGNTPLEFDITPFAQPGQPCEIAVRVTDPAGNFDWRDSQAMRWGRYALPMSHGFGGITGRVHLVVCDPVYIDDVYVQNTPAITRANAELTVHNTTGAPVTRDVAVAVHARGDDHPVFERVVRAVTLAPGENHVAVEIDAPDAKPWDLDHPNLYVCSAALRDGDADVDSDRRVFGFRWFAPEGIGSNAMFRLNGRRIVLRTSISWGFWPINGIFPTADWAEKQVRTAKALGLNMLNFHRAIGNPVVLEKADELGLLYFEEPGAYKSTDRDAFGRQLAREKLLRMVRRDRSHPSLVIYNLINEWDSRNPNPDPAEIARHRDDMAAAHEIDPSRVVVHTSAWARGEEIADPAKLHFRPFDSKPYLNGWYDVHHAGGPATWNETLYRNPDDFYGRTNNRREIVFWGEEGAISTPPRLALIKAELDHAPRLGWDGAMYLDWYRTFDAFLDSKRLRAAFPNVDAFTSAMGAVSFRHQGRRIENMRMSDVGDGYAINGWEAEIIENHSGIVDCFRNPKADPAILAYYNQPLYVAVKIRNTIVQPPASLTVDLFAVNEKNLRGPHTLEVTLRDAAGRQLAQSRRAVTLTGGDVYGELLCGALPLETDAAARGMLHVEARLLDATGAERARGHDEAVAVDWKGDAIAGRGAVWETEGRVTSYLAKVKGVNAPAFARSLPQLDWIVAARGPSEAEPAPMPASRMLLPSTGDAPAATGVQVTFFRDLNFQNPVHQRIDPAVSYAVDDGASPDPSLGVMTNYGVRWETRIVPTRTGKYTFVVHASGGFRLIVGGRTLIDAAPAKGGQTGRGTIALEADKPQLLTLELRQSRGAANCALSWIPPEEDATVATALLDRVKRDGTTLIVIDRAEAWMPLITGPANPAVTYSGAFAVGKTWLGGIHFVREHPLFSGLPVNTAMDWPYQAVVRNGDERLGLRLEGEELAAGCYHSFPMALGTAVGVIPFGRGRVIFSTLDISANLAPSEGPSIVARKLLDNFINSGSRP